MMNYSLNEWIDMFLKHLQVERGTSKNTISSYGTDLKIFAEMVEFLGCKSWRDVERTHIEKFLQETSTRFSKKTQARRLSAIRSFFKFLQRERAIEKNSAKSVRFPKPDKTLPKALSIEELKKLFNSVYSNNEEDPLTFRDIAILECLYGTGVRATELVELEMENLKLESGYITVKGKGSKERMIPLGEYAQDALRNYLQRGRPLMKAKTNKVFLNKDGNKLTRQGLWKILKEIALRAGVNKNITPHVLRHTFATHMLEGGADLKSLQMLLGHSSISSTQIYTHLALRHLKEIHEKYHPRS